MTRFPFRIVADPNVLIAAAITRNPDSPARTLVTAATQGRVQLIMCPTLWAELTAALARPKIASRLAPGGGQRFVNALRLLATEVDDPTSIPRVVSDPRDDYLIALARGERAHRLAWSTPSNNPFAVRFRNANPNPNPNPNHQGPLGSQT